MADTPQKLVQVVNPRGELVRVDERDLPTALDPKNGYRAPTEAELQSAAAADKAKQLDKGVYANLTEKGVNPIAAGALALAAPGGQFAAWREAGIEGATGGLAQVGVAKGLSAIKPEWEAAYTKELKALREAYPETRTYGNIAGNIARDAVLGGVGLPTISGSVESGVGRGLMAIGATGESALGRAGAAALRVGAGAGAESALFGATQELSEEMLGPNVQLNAEKILAAGGEQGLYGLVFGAGLGAAGSLAKSGAKGALSALANTDLRSMANEQRWRAISPSKSFTEQAQQRIPGGINKVGEVMREYGLTGNTWTEAFEGGDPGSILGKTQPAVKMVGHELQELRGASPATVRVGDLLDAVEHQIEPLRKGAGNESKVAALEAYKESLFSKLVPEAPPVAPGTAARSPAEAMKALRETQVPVQDVLFQRINLDGLIYDKANPLNISPIKQQFEKIRGVLEDRIVASIDTAAKQVGDAETGAKLLKLKGDFQALSLIERAGEKSTAGSVTNRNISPTGQLWGAAAMAASGTPLAGIPVAVGHQVIKTRGNAMAAHALDKLADLGEAMRLVKSADERLGSAARGLVGDGRGRALPGPKTTLVRRYADAVEHTSQLRAEQPKVIERAMSRPITNAPNLSAAVASTAARSVAYLVSRLPPTLDRPSMGGPQRPPRQSESEMQKFVNAYEAVKNPQVVLDNLSAGRVKREEVFALRDATPELFAELQKRALEEVMRKQASGKPLTHDQRLKLGIVFDVPTDPSLEPATMLRLQQSLQAGNKEEQKQTGRAAPQRPEDQLAAHGIDKIEAM